MWNKSHFVLVRDVKELILQIVFKSMNLGIVVSFKILIRNFEGVTTSGHVLMTSIVYTTEIFYQQNRSYYTPQEGKFYAD